MAKTMRGKKVTRRETRRDARREQSAAPSVAWTWADAEKAGEYVDRPAETMRELARRGLVRAYKIRGTGNGPKSWRFKREDLDAFITSGAIERVAV